MVVVVVGGQGACLEQHHVMSMLASWVRPEREWMSRTQNNAKKRLAPGLLLAAAVR